MDVGSCYWSAQIKHPANMGPGKARDPCMLLDEQVQHQNRDELCRDLLERVSFIFILSSSYLIMKCPDIDQNDDGARQGTDAQAAQHQGYTAETSMPD
ncbi:UNVERIFIED_CONTAM: hypothetical protein FKN15_074085 [Acipenser sinensis]